MDDAPPTSALQHSAFYRFTPLADPPAAADTLRTLAQDLCGAIIVAPEGVNGAVSGLPGALDAFERAVQAPDVLGGALAGLAFKRSPCRTAPFARLKVKVRPEIVALGLPAPATPLPPPDEADDSHLSPAAWRALLGRDDVVLLDNRNHFEFRLGHFRSAVDPGVHRFSSFVQHVLDHADAWRTAGRPVAMYCTGGVRCDKTAPWMRSLGLQVYQLQGGVLNYFQQLPDAERDWQGECFVFDRRVALDVRLQETATTAEAVFDADRPEERWRLERAQRLDRFGD
ncbi:MAG: hypothetical protein H6932_18505 [Burkholderiaceae bacterium]|nr:hypothetical protein [Burkholderiaceae bacterium]